VAHSAIGSRTAGSTPTQSGNGRGTRQAETAFASKFVGHCVADTFLKSSPARPGGIPEVQTEGVHQPAESRRSQGFTSRQHYPKPSAG
jgi:hypothetical protein